MGNPGKYNELSNVELFQTILKLSTGSYILDISGHSDCMTSNPGVHDKPGQILTSLLSSSGSKSKLDPEVRSAMGWPTTTTSFFLAVSF